MDRVPRSLERFGGRVGTGMLKCCITNRRKWKTLSAFAIISVVWGATFLAIRFGVCEVPTFLVAAMRFLIVGAVLYAISRASGDTPPAPGFSRGKYIQ